MTSKNAGRLTIADQNDLAEVENKWLFCRIKDTLKSIGRLQLNENSFAT